MKKISINKLLNLDRKYYLITLGMLYSTIFFSSFIMGYKVVDFHHHLLCASVFIFPLLFPINDSITEIFGLQVTYLLIATTIFCEFLFSTLTHTVASFPSPELWPNQNMYLSLTDGFFKIAAADSFSLAISFIINAHFLKKWGIKLSGKNFFIRSLGATAIGEFVFTIITNFIAFKSFEVANLSETLNIIFSDYIFKMIYSFLFCIPNALFVHRLKIIFKKSNPDNDKIIAFSQIKPRYQN